MAQIQHDKWEDVSWKAKSISPLILLCSDRAFSTHRNIDFHFFFLHLCWPPAHMCKNQILLKNAKMSLCRVKIKIRIKITYLIGMSI